MIRWARTSDSARIGLRDDSDEVFIATRIGLSSRRWRLTMVTPGVTGYGELEIDRDALDAIGRDVRADDHWTHRLREDFHRRSTLEPIRYAP